MKEKNKFNLILVFICLFLLFNIILINKQNASGFDDYNYEEGYIALFDNYAYEEGCMSMLAIEYNYSYPIINKSKTFEDQMKAKYMECAKLRWN